MNFKFYIQLAIALLSGVFFFTHLITFGETMILCVLGLVIGLQDHNLNKK